MSLEFTIHKAQGGTCVKCGAPAKYKEVVTGRPLPAPAFYYYCEDDCPDWPREESD